MKTPEEIARDVVREWYANQWDNRQVLERLMTQAIIADRAERDKRVIEVLEEIHKGYGEFSKDRLTHASNTIESMKSLASALLAELRKDWK